MGLNNWSSLHWVDGFVVAWIGEWSLAAHWLEREGEGELMDGEHWSVGAITV